MPMVHVVAVTLGVMVALQDAATPTKPSLLAGHWVANISRSKINPKYPVRRATLTIAVTFGQPDRCRAR